MLTNKLLCRFLGHRWVGAGWDKGPSDCLAVIWLCSRCHLRADVLEPLDSVQARFDGYRAMYGDSRVSGTVWSAPLPGVYETVYR